VAPVVFAVSLVIVILTSLVTAPCAEAKLKAYVWNMQVFKDETGQLAGVPWYKNYRVLAVLLLVITGLFVFIWR